ncbi:MAG: hypothetical protein ACR2MX_11205, partial [Cyclobacteriaceae bacterium]
MKPKEKPTTSEKSRRAFLASAAALSSMSFIPGNLRDVLDHAEESVQNMANNRKVKDGISIIGGYGPWAAGIVKDPPLLSFRNPRWSDLENWRSQALAKTQELVAVPSKSKKTPDVAVKANYEYDGLAVEELQWQLPYGRPTEAILLKPAGATGQLPAVLGLHDHGGQKYFGKRKITKTSDDPHPVMAEHQESYYSGMAWANELAKRGYVVLVHDTFTFASRRVWYEDISSITWGACNVDDKSDENPEDPENIKAYNAWAGEHEHIMAKSLFCAGTTWPGVTLAEDQSALDILCARPDVASDKVGCCGLSGGGLRSNYLGGLDHRIKCAISVGFMSTWKDFLMHKSYTHTWMTYASLLPKYLEFPEILGLRVPLPTMVMSNNEDELY